MSSNACRRTVHRKHPQSAPARGRLSAALFRAVALIGSLAVSGCVTEDDTRTYTYDYTAQTRLAAERRAAQDIHDSCYFSGAQYPELVGPPQVVTEGAAADKHFRATQAFYCVGTLGGP